MARTVIQAMQNRSRIMSPSCETRAARNPRLGFTLAEMLVVLVILAVLTTVAVQSLEPVAQQSRIEATEKTLENIQQSLLNVTQTAGNSSISGFLSDLRRLPVSFDELYVNLNSDPLWRGPYLLPSGGSAAFVDAWNQPLRLTFTDVPGTNLKPALDSFTDLIVLSSDGRDGVAANADDIVRRIPATTLSARELRVRLYGIDAQGNSIDLNATGSATLQIVPVGSAAAPTNETLLPAGTDLVAVKPAIPPTLLIGAYAVTATFTPTAASSGTAYSPNVRVNVLMGASHTVDLLVFRGATSSASGSPGGGSTGNGASTSGNGS